MNFEMMYEIWRKSGTLRSVKILRYQGLEGVALVKGVSFQFSNAALSISITEDTDEVMISEEDLLPLEDEEKVLDVSDDPEWSDVIGLTARWFWLLRNQQGYEDGMRIEFANVNKIEQMAIGVTLIAGACVFEISRDQAVSAKISPKRE